MKATSKPISIQGGLAWGTPGAPFLPRSLLTRWADEILPEWVCKALRIPTGSRIAGLGDPAPVRDTSLPATVQHFLVFLVHTRRRAIGDLVAVDRVWPPGLAFEDVPWKRRTVNCLRRLGLHHHLAELSRDTFEGLFAIQNMGARSILDFACTLEATIDHYNQIIGTAGDLTARRESGLSQILLDALNEPWADRVSEQDPRFSRLLPAGKGTVTERIDRLTTSPEATEADFVALAEAIAAVRDRINAMEDTPLETALREYLSAVSGLTKEKHLDALLSRLHWDGSAEGKTLEEAGAVAGVTRERIRQLQSRTLGRLPSHPVVMPALDKALQLLSTNTSVDSSVVASLLRRERITVHPFQPSSILSVARSCGRTPNVRIETVGNHSIVVHDTADRSTERLIRIAYAQASTSGASNLLELLSEAERRYNIRIAPEEAKQTLERFGDLEFLDSDWFWNPNRLEDSLRNLTRKMLSVATPIEVGALREGVRRAFRFRRIAAAGRTRVPNVPPRDILAAYYRAHPEFVLGEAGMVRSARSLDYRVELVGVEQVLARVLRASPTNFLDRAGLLEGCLALGVNPSTLWTILSYSSVVQNIGPGLWSLRGLQVNAVAVDAALQSEAMRPREKRVMDYGWASDGHLWIAVRLPKRAELQRLFNVPAAVKRFVDGRNFPACTEAGEHCGNLRIYENGTCGGFGEFLRRVGADEGDVLHVSFDIAKGSAILRLVDDEDLEELSPVA